MNGVCLDRVGKFCYLGDMLSGRVGLGVNSALLVRVLCGWGKFRELSGILISVTVVKREGVCNMCEECNGLIK